MKRCFVFLAVALIMGIASGAAAATDTTTIGVNAVVTSSCSFATARDDVNFGDFDAATVAADVVSTTNPGGNDGYVVVRCDSTHSFTLSDNSTGLMTDTGSANTLAYSLSYDDNSGTPAGLGVGVDEQFDIVGTIATVDAQAAVPNTAGNYYTEQVTFTITF